LRIQRFLLRVINLSIAKRLNSEALYPFTFQIVHEIDWPGLRRLQDKAGTQASSLQLSKTGNFGPPDKIPTEKDAIYEMRHEWLSPKVDHRC